MDADGQPILGQMTIDEVALACMEKQGFIKGVEFLLEWNPVEKEGKDEDE